MNNHQLAVSSPESSDTEWTDNLLVAQQRVLEGIVRGAGLQEVLGELCQIVEAQATRSVRAAILLLDETGTRLFTGAAPSLPASYSDAIDGIAIDPNVGTCCAAAARVRVVITPDIGTCQSWRELRQLPLSIGLQAAWSMPILSSSGAVLGTFGTYFLTPSEPTAREQQLIGVLSRTAALAIERQRNDEALRIGAVRNQFLADLANATQPLADPAELMSTAARMLAEHLDADRCAYAEVEEESVFVITGDHVHGVPSIVGRWSVAAFGPACVQAMQENAAYVVTDTDTDSRISPEALTAYRATQIRAVICVPLHKDGRLTAAMAVHQTLPRKWTAGEIELVNLVVARCWEALERSRIARNLRESEARYRMIVAATPECVKLVDADGAVLQMNSAGLRMIEAASEQAVIGHCVYDVIAPEHRAAFRDFNERVCRGEDGTFEFEIVGFNGTRRSMESTSVPLPLPAGGFGQLAITRDVTERVKADRALAVSRARLDYAVRLSGVGFWYCDLPFEELIWDERVKAHFFLPPDTRVTIDTFYDRIHPEDREATRNAIETSIERKVAYDVIYRTVDRQSGDIKFIRALGGTAYGDDGQPLRFDGVTLDVTAQRLHQERLREALELEQRQGRLLRKIAEAALKIYACDSLDRVLEATAEQARAVIGAHQAVTSLTIDEPLNGWLAVPLVARNGARLGLVQLSDKYEGEFTEADEAVLTQLAQMAAVAIENTRLYNELREQDRRKDEFLATLAHELRNPLAPIRTGLEVLQRSSDPDRSSRARQMMARQLGHLVRMVDDLLDISRITLGKVTLQKERVDFRTVLNSAMETARPLIEASNHEFALRLTKNELPLHVDPTRVAQILANLLNNAARYTPAGGRIQLTADKEDAALVVRVNDSGMGIPPDMLTRIFDMFTQAHRSLERAQGGLGIGLTLVKRLVELHGGSIHAESAGPNQGSTFILRLPLASTSIAEAASSDESSWADQATLRVLVVDDNVDAAECLGMLLQLQGHEVRLVHDGIAGLAAVQGFLPDVVLLDLGLPDLDGYEVARRVRAEVNLRQPRLVALTGWGSEEDRRRVLAAGFDHHLVKPVPGSVLEEVLAKSHGL